MPRLKTDDPIVIVGAARTPIGAYLGGLKTVPVSELGAIALKEAIKRAGLANEEIEEVIAGQAMGTQEESNIGRVIGLKAGLRQQSTGMTVNRVCGSGIQSAISAVQELMTMDMEFIAAGGVESLSRSEYYLPLEARWEGFKVGNFNVIDANLALHVNTQPSDDYTEIHHMGDTAEKIAERYSITREEQDAFAVDSQSKTAHAMDSGRLAQEIVSVEVKDRKGNVTVVDTDEHPRPGTNMEGLARLKPAFRKDGKGTITAGNSSGLNDGAAFEIFTKLSVAKERGLDVMAKIVDFAVVGCDPNVMGLGPVYAINKVLEQNDLTLEDIAILEINEAFAAQTLGCMKELGIKKDSELYGRLNPNGGAISLGHPLGMSGARILTSICYEFKNHPEKKYAIASACIGGGQGIALLVENGFVN
ncbi:acetyl-CoA C-acetyltransferase [Carnobacterium alterfunditum]|uniref:acetyl-CoA C-acetyltransferase n=1 Tax=Carnobacterium alterfunditum TaxID=28230 RepID=A0A1N6HA30_9LACT|nr:thiolase family protein [Carnobacterium alterfunditum]SIO16537.1 acetyl-CoA C-acetyltransferase [Carnobacterium alterfunditum]